MFFHLRPEQYPKSLNAQLACNYYEPKTYEPIWVQITIYCCIWTLGDRVYGYSSLGCIFKLLTTKKTLKKQLHRSLLVGFTFSLYAGWSCLRPVPVFTRLNTTYISSTDRVVNMVVSKNKGNPNRCPKILRSLLLGTLTRYP